MKLNLVVPSIALFALTQVASAEKSMVMHAAYDETFIDQSIALNTQRVATDPEGPIGWAMLADAWLARSRESDSDQAAWKAEEAARKSLSLREAGNSHALVALVDSLLEQHRFQDALAILEKNHVRSRLYADVLIEVGRLDEAEACLKKLGLGEDPSIYAAMARLEMARGDHKASRDLLEKSYKMLLSNPGVPSTTIAWFDVKLGDEMRATHNDAQAQKLYLEALRLHPRNYKANLAMSRLMASHKKYDESIKYAKATLLIADSLDAKALIGDAFAAMGKKDAAKNWYDTCHASYLSEVALFDKLGKGGDYHVRPIDRQFAHFAVTHRMFVEDGLVAAKRDYANRPDRQAQQTLAMLTQYAVRSEK